MPQQDQIKSIRFEKVTLVRMVRVEHFDSSNVNDPRDEREYETVLAAKTERLPENKVAEAVKSISCP